MKLQFNNVTTLFFLIYINIFVKQKNYEIIIWMVAGIVQRNIGAL